MVKVLDFGIAKFDRNSSVKTQQNIALGTPDYMAPEQAAGKPASPSMDLYALGVMGFEMLVGHPPFAHESIMALLIMHQQQPPPVPSSLVPSLPAILDEFVLKLLAKRPQDRYASADAVRARIRELRRDLADETAMPTTPGGLRLDESGERGGDVSRRRTAKPVARKPARAEVAPPTEVSLSPTQAQSLRRSPWPLVALVSVVIIAGGAVAWFAMSKAPPPDTTPPDTMPPLEVRVEPAEPRPTTPAPPEPARQEPEEPDVAPLSPVVKKSPPPAEVLPPRAASAAVRRASLGKRIGRLSQRLAQIEAEGGSVGLERQQVTALQSALRGSPDAKTLDQVEVALERLEEDTK